MHAKSLLAVLCTTAILTVVAVETADLGHAAEATRVVGYRRLTESEYRNSIADIFGPTIQVQGRFEPEIRIGGLLAASSATLSVTPAGFESYAKMADEISQQVVSAKYRAKLVPCLPKAPDGPDDKCAKQFFAQYGLAAFRRPLTDAELQARVALASNIAKSTKDFYAGLHYGLASILAAPAFLLRTEAAVPDGKNFTLDGYSRATRLSYLMWDTTPDAELLRAAQSGELSTDAGIAKQVNRLMASPRLEIGMRAFFSDMLAPDYYGNVTKDTTIYPKWSDAVTDSAKEETLRTVIDLTLKQNGDVRDLLTTRKTFLNRTLAAIYNVPYDFNAEWAPYEYAADSGRSGVLTQLSVLGMFSHPGRSSPTERGKAILDIFMCSPTPPPPPNVDFSLVNDVNNPTLKTVRQRLLAHATNPTCASCHTHMDPIGLSLENFDSSGQYRSSENGEPIDASATISGKSFVGAVGLGKVLHDEPRYPMCLARKLYSYGVGMDSSRTKPAQYKTAFDAFTGSNYRLRVLLQTMATSPDFFAESPPPVENPAAKANTVAGTTVKPTKTASIAN